MNVFSTTALLAALTAVAAPAHAETIRLDQFMQTGRTVDAVINGQAGTFMFDTGGGISVITPQFAGKIGCKPWGQLTGHQMSGKRLDAARCDNIAAQLGQLHVKVDAVGVFDIQKLLPPDARKIDGSLALDLFDDKVVTFSQSASVITVLDAVPPALQRVAAMPVHLVRESEGFSLTVSLPVRTPAGTAWFEMDSGNTSPYSLVSKTISESMGMGTELEKEQTVGFTLGDGKAVKLKAIVLDLIIDGNLGVNFLSQYDVTVDLKHRRGWIVPVAAHR